jgi:hypothetical protein
VILKSVFYLSLSSYISITHQLLKPGTKTMIKKLLFFFVVLTATLSAIAQTVELTPIAGYTFRSTVNITGGQARINDGFTYGGALTFAPSPYNAIEISYSRYETTATAQSSYVGFEAFSDDVAVNYMFIGGQRLFPASDKVTGFTGFNLGAAWLGSKDETFSTITKLAIGFDLGVKIMASEKVGIRLQTNLGLPITSSGGSYYWGTNGSGVGLTGYVPIWSFGFNGGLIFKLK